MKIIGPNGLQKIKIPLSAKLIRNHEMDILITDEGASEIYVARNGLTVWVTKDGITEKFVLPELGNESNEKDVRAPMTAKVVSIPKKVGDEIFAGETVAILEAMKMEYRLEAEVNGKIAEIGANVGDLVDLGQLLVRLE